ncbi:unnamed protein product, partial [Strongylus vulgaris]
MLDLGKEHFRNLDVFIERPTSYNPRYHMRFRSALQLIMAALVILLLVLHSRRHRSAHIDLTKLFPNNVNTEPAGVKNKIAILDVIESDTRPAFYQHAMCWFLVYYGLELHRHNSYTLFDIYYLSVACYARAQGYEFRIVFSSNYSAECPHSDVYLRRHCVVAHVLPHYHTILRIEEYIAENVEITFFDRFYNWEVAAGSYIVKNTEWTQKFLKDFADYEYRLPKYYHGTDNGALHGTAWVRDNWMTNTKWSPERDFMLHNWKVTQLHGASKGEWFVPFKGHLQLDLCTAGNTTWNYDPNLIETPERIEVKLQTLYDRIDRERIKSLARMKLESKTLLGVSMTRNYNIATKGSQSVFANSGSFLSSDSHE